MKVGSEKVFGVNSWGGDRGVSPDPFSRARKGWIGGMNACRGQAGHMNGWTEDSNK